MNKDSDQKVQKKRRRSRQLSSSTRQLVLLEAGYMCANPCCRHILTLEIHHIIWVRDDGGNEASNLLALCPNCHSLHTAGHIPAEAIKVWKGVLLSLNSYNRAIVDILLYLYRQKQSPIGQYIQYSGDALLHMASLFNAGLIEIESGHVISGCGSFEIKLTASGEALVEAWLSGDEGKLALALKKP
jgi:hypothetical protein